VYKKTTLFAGCLVIVMAPNLATTEPQLSAPETVYFLPSDADERRR
jgi:hypothetical protein